MAIGYGFCSLSSDPYTYYDCSEYECLYCGDVATLYDHVLPIAVYNAAPNVCWPKEVLVLVPCCNRCNLVASNNVFTSLSAKYNYVRNQRKLSRVYA
jgi:5-methylcytosine-specific restriction endonuclease McrA